MGPLGSGKSTACVMEILTRSQDQKPNSYGMRMTRWAIIRNSYPELKTTSIKTWLQWVPERFGKLTMSTPLRHHVVQGDMDMEVYFLALDRAEDVKKLLSMELTGAWMNEAREQPKAVLDGVTGRVGRYPEMIEGGPTWQGVIMDTNPPDDQSWWYDLAEKKTPEKFEFFKQPGGRDKNAENIPNLRPGYYEDLCLGKDPDWVQVYVDSNYGYLIEGKPVFQSFRDRTHVSPTILKPDPQLKLLIGVDFGLTPAAVIGQKNEKGQWRILDEYVTDDMGVVRFAQNLSAFLRRKYPDMRVGGGWGDPAGRSRGMDEETAFSIMNEYCPLDPLDPTVVWQPAADKNDLDLRFEAVNVALDRMVDGDPGFLLSPDVPTMRKGFNGGYHFKYLKNGDGRQTQEFPSKNKHSHIMDALQYLLLGAGAYHSVIRKVEYNNRFGKGPAPVIMAKDLDYDLFN